MKTNIENHDCLMEIRDLNEKYSKTLKDSKSGFFRFTNRKKLSEEYSRKRKEIYCKYYPDKVKEIERSRDYNDSDILSTVIAAHFIGEMISEDSNNYTSSNESKFEGFDGGSSGGGGAEGSFESSSSSSESSFESSSSESSCDSSSCDSSCGCGD